MTHLTAHDIAASPELFYAVVRFGNSKIEWECLGYTGKLIKFARLIPLKDQKIRVVNVYKKPDAPVTIVSNETEIAANIISRK